MGPSFPILAFSYEEDACQLFDRIKSHLHVTGLHVPFVSAGSPQDHAPFVRIFNRIVNNKCMHPSVSYLRLPDVFHLVPGMLERFSSCIALDIILDDARLGHPDIQQALAAVTQLPCLRTLGLSVPSNAEVQQLPLLPPLNISPVRNVSLTGSVSHLPDILSFIRVEHLSSLSVTFDMTKMMEHELDDALVFRDLADWEDDDRLSEDEDGADQPTDDQVHDVLAHALFLLIQDLPNHPVLSLTTNPPSDDLVFRISHPQWPSPVPLPLTRDLICRTQNTFVCQVAEAMRLKLQSDWLAAHRQTRVFHSTFKREFGNTLAGDETDRLIPENWTAVEDYAKGWIDVGIVI
jgi:hypothetical protein